MENKYLALLVEDDQNWVKYFQEIVERDVRNYFDFHYAENLKDALTSLDKYSYSLILLDLMLPDSQGQDTVLAITKQVRYAPIVIFTTFSDKQMEEFAYTQGIQDYLIKGEYNEKMFFHVVNSAVRRCISRIQQELFEDLSELTSKLKAVTATLDKALTE